MGTRASSVSCLGCARQTSRLSLWHASRRALRPVPESIGLAAIADAQRRGQESNGNHSTVCASMDDFAMAHNMDLRLTGCPWMKRQQVTPLETIVMNATLLVAVYVPCALRSWEGSQTQKTTTMTKRWPTTSCQRLRQHQVRPLLHLVRPQHPWNKHVHTDEWISSELGACRTFGTKGKTMSSSPTAVSTRSSDATRFAGRKWRSGCRLGHSMSWILAAQDDARGNFRGQNFCSRWSALKLELECLDVVQRGQNTQMHISG